MILHRDGFAAGLLLRKVKHSIILSANLNLIQHMASCDYCSAIDVDTHIGVNTGIGTIGASCSNHCTAIDHQPAVRIDTITFAGFSCDLNGQLTTIDSSNGNTIFVGIDTVITGLDANVTAIDGKMHFAVKTFVFSLYVQHAGVFLAAKDIHRPLGIECTIVLVQLVRILNLGLIVIQNNGIRLIDFFHIGAVHGIDCSVGNDHIGTGSGGVHILRCLFRIIVSALIDIIEDHRRGNFTGDIHAIQNQRYHSVGVFLGIVPQVYCDLSKGQLTAQAINSGFCNMHHSMCSCLIRRMGILFTALTVSKVLAGLVVNNIVSCIDRSGSIGTNCSSVHGNATIAQNDLRRIVNGRCGRGLYYRSRRCLLHRLCVTGRQQKHQRQQNRQQI